uniref:Uncharacterized protein n=1 Tax=Manihot esculenta TaxID=3983 RepID=A0A2C9WGA8_MANES
MPQNVHITVCKLISSEYIMIWYDHNFLTVPNLEGIK